MHHWQNNLTVMREGLLNVRSESAWPMVILCQRLQPRWSLSSQKKMLLLLMCCPDSEDVCWCLCTSWIWRCVHRPRKPLGGALEKGAQGILKFFTTVSSCFTLQVSDHVQYGTALGDKRQTCLGSQGAWSSTVLRLLLSPFGFSLLQIPKWTSSQKI